MPGKLHEAVLKAQGVGLPVVPFAEGKVPGTGLSLAVSEYMQGVSNPQMPQEACADCGHEVCPEGCPCANPDCPGKKEQRPNGRMKGAEPLGGMAHEVRKAINLIDGDRVVEDGGQYVTVIDKRGVTEGTVVEIDGDKVTIWNDKDEKPADKVKEAIKSTTDRLRQEDNSATVSEMKSGLAKWLQSAREAKKVGNDKRAASIMAAIDKVVTEKNLDEPTVYNWTEAFKGALKPEYSRSDFSESINDKNLFKAVFTAGGPGSGKSFIAGGMFKGTGARFVNSDIFFEFLLKKKGLPFKMDPSKKVMYGKQIVARGKGKKLATSQAGHWVNGMLPLVVDGTGREIGKIKKQKTALEKVGYDTSMVFVNTTLDVALQRNQARKRSVPEDFVKKSWQAVQKNIGKFQSLFSGNMTIVDNSVAISGADLGDLKTRLARSAMKMLGQGLRNPMGRNTIAALQRQGGKYISDIDPDFGKADHIGI